MRIKNATIDTFTKGKKSIKIPIIVNCEKGGNEVLKNIHNFLGKDLIIDINIDSEAQKIQNSKISDEQRRKIYCLIRIYAKHEGLADNQVHDDFIQAFCEEKNLTYFSLSDVHRETAKIFIEWLIEKLLEYGCITEQPIRYTDNIQQAVDLTLKKRICIICGQAGEVHHIDAIGMGRNRLKYNDTDHRKICLCRKHHTEVETAGRSTFLKKYYLQELEK